MKTICEVTVTRNWSANAHKVAGFFPNIEMAKIHVESWPLFIRESLSVSVKDVEDDAPIVPPEHMQNSVAKLFFGWRDENAEHIPVIQRQAFMDNPWHDFDDKKVPHIHEWRKYMNADVRALWPSFTMVQRLALAKNAQEIADDEDWG